MSAVAPMVRRARPLDPLEAERRTAVVLVSQQESRWQDLVRTHPLARPFHHPAWTRTLAESYGYRSFAVALEDESGVLRAGLPLLEVNAFGRKRWLSLPFTDCCPPLAASGAERDLLILGLSQLRAAADVGAVEIRSEITSPGVYSTVDAVLHTLDLDADADAIFRTFSRSQVQRNIARAVREGVVVRRAADPDALTKTFYRLHTRTRRRQGIPVQPLRFFEQLWRHLIAEDLGFVLLAYAGDRPIAGAVFLCWNGTVVYKFGASDPAYWGLRPNNLIFWDAIQWSCANGYESFDFGKTDVGNAGLRAFKSHWGTREEQLAFSTIADRPPRATIERGTGPVSAVIRRSPSWVGRAVGTALYRYAA